MSAFFHEILYRPLFNLLVGIYNIVPGHDLGLAIILMTILIRIVFVPLSIKSLISQRAMSKLQPKLKELQDKHKDDKQAFAQAQMALWKEHKVNPLSGCFPILVQLPILWTLYRVFINGVKPGAVDGLYAFVHNPGPLAHVAFGFLDLAGKNPALAIVAGFLQGVQAWLMSKNQPSTSDNPAAAMTKQMMYFFPIMIVVISWSLPAGLVLYWVATTAFSIVEQLYIRRRYADTPQLPPTPSYR